MTDADTQGPQPTADAEDAKSPTVTFEEITFSDGTIISLEPADVVVLVGPNNAGKSEALRELEAHIGPKTKRTVVTSAELSTTGSKDDLVRFLETHSQMRSISGVRQYHGLRYSFAVGDVPSWWPGGLQQLRPLFCLRVQTATRITDSDHAKAIATLRQHPQHPIHLLYVDPDIEQRLSDYFRRAFDNELILYREGGSEWPLLVGMRPALVDGETIHSRDYNIRLLEATTELEKQGDGMRAFASVILHMLAPVTPSVLLLDEPEAFLHPPQARLAGEFIVKEKPQQAQLFIATHSTDVLQGLLGAGPEHLRILRIQRDGAINRVKELDKARTEQVGADPLLKFSGVMSGIFYQRVVIAESDADCMFYSTVLDLPSVRGDVQPDVLFVHGGGKDRLAPLAEALRALDVDVDVIADMDVLKDDTVLKRIVEALDGDWAKVKALVDPVRQAIEQHKSWLNAPEIVKGISEVLEKAPGEGAFPDNLQKEIVGIFRKASPWDAVKDAGKAAIPAGRATQQFGELLSLSKKMRLWIVPVGELENFCKSVGGHGPRWVQQVIETKDLSGDNELDAARDFVRELWSRKPTPDGGKT